MVCEPRVGGKTSWRDAMGTSAADKASFAAPRRPPTPAVQASTQRPGQPGTSPAVKEMLRIRKKVREIEKIEEKVQARQPVDPLQFLKLGKKGELIAQLEQAERAVAQEELGRQGEVAARLERDERTVAQEAREDWEAQREQPRLQTGARGDGQPWVPIGSSSSEPEAVQFQPAQVYPLLGGFPQDGAPAQQKQATEWQKNFLAHGIHVALGAAEVQEVKFGSFELATQAPATESWGEEPTNSGEPSSSPQVTADDGLDEGMSVQEDSVLGQMTTSQRRRERRQRAAHRRPEIPEESARERMEGEPDADELSRKLEAGGEAMTEALRQMRDWVVALSFAKDGCRVVQLALQVADHRAAGELMSQLKGHTQEAIDSPHANFVIQAAISSLPTASAIFIVQELADRAAATAKHRFGCRVLCRLIEHCGQSPEMVGEGGLLKELLDDAQNLCRHAFAHYVIQCMLEHLPETRGRIAQALRADLAGLARHRCASHVVEAAVEHCTEEDRGAIISELLGQGLENVVPLAQSQYGSFVLKAILRLPGGHCVDAWQVLTEAVDLLSTHKYAQRLLKDLRLWEPPAPTQG